jgi:hypothetical protein
MPDIDTAIGQGFDWHANSISAYGMVRRGKFMLKQP